MRPALSGITVGSGLTLSPAFDPSVYEYTIDAPWGGEPQQSVSFTITKTADVYLGLTPESTVYGTLTFYQGNTIVRTQNGTKQASDNPTTKTIGATFGSQTADCDRAVHKISVNKDGVTAEYTITITR